MPGILGFGTYLPARVVTNAELAAKLGCDEEWIFTASGICERRYAHESVSEMAIAAARDCLERASVEKSIPEVGLLIASSGSAERRFPGPAATVASGLGLAGVPAIDLPLASAGSLFGMSLASRLAPAYGNVLVVAAEKMSAAIGQDKNTAILFGDGAGACLIGNEDGPCRIVDSVLHSEGAFAEHLRLGLSGVIHMNGRSVIMQAARKIPSAIVEVLERNGKTIADPDVCLMHQANQNLIDKVARTLGVATEKFFSNIRAYGNTSSASMLIAASEWWSSSGSTICFAAFGAGFHWGALLAKRDATS
jgi:3-oxoacyl-[acyl-carrier-protein] synthase-3